MIDNKKISVEDQKEYQYRVGVLLFLMKQSRPDIATKTKDLSKANDSVQTLAYGVVVCDLIFIGHKKSWLKVRAN